MKKFISFALAAALMTSVLSGCAKTKSQVEGNGSNGAASSKNQAASQTNKPEDIRLLAQSSNEKDMNIMRDQLTKAGFNVIINMQPDYSSFKTAVESGQYDLALSGWTTVTGNPDYAVRSIYHSLGSYNNSPIKDEKVDELIDKAAGETPAQYEKTYTDLENYMITENAYLVPIYSSPRIHGVNNKVVDPATVKNAKSRSFPWEQISYVDASLNATRPLIMTQTGNVLTSLDPIQANDGSVNALSTNMHIRLVNLTSEDDITAEGSLSYNYAIGEGNDNFYFILKDNAYFSKVENGKAVNTGVRVGADDVVFTFERAMDKDSVPDHRTYSLYESITKVEVVNDVNVLNETKDSDTGKPIIEILSKGLPGEVKELVEDKTLVNNAEGKYQVVKISTKRPFPQVLNYLAHQSAGIVSKEQISKINANFNKATFDPTKDVAYGNFSVLKGGKNDLWFSGPYALISVDDYNVKFQKNPGYLTGSEFEPKIEHITYKFIKDSTGAVSAFRSGEIDVLPFVDETGVEVLSSNSNFTVETRTSNGVAYAEFNMREGSKFTDKDLRLAVLYAINQNDYIAVHKNLKSPCYSTISTLIDTGNVHKQDLAKSAEHLAAYQAKSK